MNRAQRFYNSKVFVGPFRQYYGYPLLELRQARVMFDKVFSEDLPRFFNASDVERFLCRQEQWKTDFDLVLEQLLEVFKKRQVIHTCTCTCTCKSFSKRYKHKYMDYAELDEWN